MRSIGGSLHGVACSQNETNFRPWLAFFDLQDPLAADLDASGKFPLVQAELAAALTDDEADVEASWTSTGASGRRVSVR